MGVLAKRLFAPAQLTASAATYYTAPANTRTVISKLTFCNTTATARTVTVHIIPSGGTATASNKIWDAVVVPPTGSGQNMKECFEAKGHVLEPGDFIQMLADSATAVTAEGSGSELT